MPSPSFSPGRGKGPRKRSPGPLIFPGGEREKIEKKSRFSAGAARALEEAYASADRMGHGLIGSEHLLIGLFREKDGEASPEARRLEEETAKLLGRGEAWLLPRGLTPAAKRILRLSAMEAGEREIGTGELFSAIRREGQNAACRYLRERERACENAKERNEDRPGPRAERRALPQSVARYGADLTSLYEMGKLMPVTGREKETREVMRILARRTKNHPVLLGEPGVGKTAVAEKLAAMLSEGKTPPVLSGKRLFALDPAALLAGTKYRGELEERMETLLREIEARDDLILFFDEMHVMSGAGGAEGAISLSELLKPALSRGNLFFLGADTPEEYRKAIEKDPALARRFSPVEVREPDRRETEAILRGLIPVLEEHHGVRFREEAVPAAVELAERYLPDRYFPDKALDLLDEAAGEARLQSSGHGAPSALWKERERALEKGDYVGAGRLRERLLAAEKSGDRRLPPPGIGKEELERLLSEKTGIPLLHLKSGEEEKLLSLEKSLKTRVIGQEAAVDALCRALRRNRAGLRAPGRPVGSFLFTGSTGVGKTELAKALAEGLFGEEKALLRFDMTEFGEENAVNRLIGAPPGYAGYGEGGELTRAVRRRPYAVVLFDEIEKAAPRVTDLFLQLLDDGRLTDGEGKTAHFENAVVIFTSNAGAPPAGKRAGGMGFLGNGGAKEEEILSEVRKVFRPEFLGRLDGILPFAPLGEETLLRIAEKELGAVRKRARAGGIDFLWERGAAQAMAREAVNAPDGARALRKRIEREAADRLAGLILAGKKEIRARLVFHGGAFALAEEG